ncbi:TraX family protein [Clostridium sp. UBA6640]|uniref:TraX family protein n=1 Tax=Clostridium sp. UBA6640 TaxID=1946370 RepID=UPI0025C6F166|nr:TraX family protein [Clostridium sp. UBA6640]
MLNRFQLKLIMIFFMLLDHIASFVPNTPLWFHYIGRLVAPTFFFLLIDGYFHTRSKYNYAKRLFVASGIMASGNMLITTIFPSGITNGDVNIYLIGIIITAAVLISTYIAYKTPSKNMFRIIFCGVIMLLAPIIFSIFFTDVRGVNNNIFLSMAFSIVLLNFIEIRNKENNNSLTSLSIVTILFLSLFTEGSTLGPILTFIFYHFRDKKLSLVLFYSIFSLLFMGSNFSYNGLFVENIQWMMIFSIPFFFSYNGKKGSDIKYLFYAFYPIHIWILYIIGFFMKR